MDDLKKIDINIEVNSNIIKYLKIKMNKEDKIRENNIIDIIVNSFTK
jgi:hypothetical protein